MVKNLKEGEEVQITRVKTSPPSTQGAAPDSTETQAAMTLCVTSQMLADAGAQSKSKEKPTEKAKEKSKAKNKKEKS
ncbi:hypothetical protein CSB45_15470 [candidate division KSB3 bacterium]|uniref:Uncharacterized protein n=1 Tax=candidate division KSB3 bacterium TaxID=2044937 RepID=A0A2G6E0G0_9BACT|nr:MAG: hypothetical protein CSB45_15470 [candidate division KSB3 bacterium]